MNKPIFYYSVMTGNRGDKAIRKSITNAICSKINVPISYFNIKYEELTEERIVKQLNKDASCLMIAGSGLYTNYPMSSGWYFPCRTEFFEKIKVPIFLIGLGCNNNLKKDIFRGELTEKTKQSIKLINDLATVSTVRDQRTYDILKDIGVAKHKLMPDPANFLQVPSFKKERLVTINMAQHAPLLGRFDGGTEGQMIRQKNINLFVKICNYLKTRGYNVSFVTHDALEHSLVIDLKKEFSDLTFINTDNINQMLELYAKSSFSIGMKMHSNILSFASGTPFISLYYDVKSPEYLNLLGLGDFGKSIFDVDFGWIKYRMNNLISYNTLNTTVVKRLKRIYQEPFNKVIKTTCDIIETQN